MRYLIKLEYDGTDFIGWQKQDKGRSIQAALETAVETFAKVRTPVVAAGRTDAGVHALGQRAHFDYTGAMHPTQMLLAFRRWLPRDIKVKSITRVKQDFSARYQAFERHYRYVLSKSINPFTRNFAGFIPHLKIQAKAMQDAAPFFLGRHDFSTFGRYNPEVPNPICHLKELQVFERDDDIIFELRSDRFLHNMVRRIVGTLANISHFGLPPETISQLLAQKNPRQRLVLTVPAPGLYLLDVKYPDSLLDGETCYTFDEILLRKR